MYDPSLILFVLQIRVQPHPDPERKKATKWMSMEELDAEALKPSRHWVESGYGKLGKIYIEVIGCDDLPNMVRAFLAAAYRNFDTDCVP